MDIQLEKSKLPRAFLCTSDISLYTPNIGFFENLVDNNEYFAFVRWNAGTWDLIYYGMMEYNKNWPELFQDKKVGDSHWPMPEYLSKHYLKGLAQSCCNLLHAQQWNVYTLYWWECLKIMVAPKQPNFFCGVTLRCWQNFNYNLDAGLPIIKKFCQHYINDLFHGYCWKNFCSNGSIEHFITKYKDRPVVFVGPEYFTGFGQAYNMHNFRFIPIPYRAASRNTAQIYESVKQGFQKGSIVYIVASHVGTVLANWILRDLKEAFVLDVGRALDRCHNDLFYGQMRQIDKNTLDEVMSQLRKTKDYERAVNRLGREWRGR
jgi:hypothetical protein